jgi:predicted SprT family Zn-dependent metalloprotease
LKGRENRMLYTWDIEKIIEKTLNDHNLDINYEFSNKLTAPMSYNVSTNTIKFNYLQINGYKAKINFKIKESDENFIKIILYHEIGYYLDFKKNKHDLRILMYGGEEEKQQLMAEIEYNAWEYGRTLVPGHLLNSYDKVRKMDDLLLKSR